MSGQIPGLLLRGDRSNTADTLDDGDGLFTAIDAAPRLVIAIDFGTFATGYALQWRTDYTSDRLKIHCNTKWASTGFCTYKTPTCLLLKPDETLVEFGYEAERIFSILGTEDSDLYSNENPENWYFFRHFKMMLYHREEINDSTPVEAAHGKDLPAIDVFSKSVEYIKNHAIDHLKESGFAYPEAETKWVITVPAIWNDQAKQLMRKAAEKAGLISANLTIALEPECAAIYCSQIPAEQLEIEGDCGKLKNVAAPGSTVMVVDMGGGTIDITTLQIQPDSTMKQVYMSGGGHWEGMTVDGKFFMMLRDIVGADVMKSFAENNRIDEYDLRMEFESKKQEVKHPSKPNANDRFRIKLPSSLRELWEKKNGKNVTAILRSRNDQEEVKYMSGRLSFDVTVIRGFFIETINEILGYVDTVLRNPEHEGLAIDSLILVGSFAESNYVVQSIREGLKEKGIPVVRPQPTELAVLNGAVLFGQNEDIMTSRIMRYTYGVGMVMEFNPEKQSQDKMFEDKEKKKLAMNVFRKHVTRGDVIKLGQWISDKEYYLDNDRQESATIVLYASDKKDPIHTDEIGCKYIGQMDINFSDPSRKGTDGNSQKVKAVGVAMNFGGTEVKIKVVDKIIGKVFQKSFKLQ